MKLLQGISLRFSVTSLVNTCFSSRLFWRYFLLGMVPLLVMGCGGQSQAPVGELPTDKGTDKDAVTLNAVAGSDRVAYTGGVTYLDATASTSSDAGSAGLTYRWQQTQGPKALLDPNSSWSDATLAVLLPGVKVATELTFTLTVSHGAHQHQDELVVTVEPCNLPEGVAFDGCSSQKFGPLIAFASSPSGKSVYWDGEADRHVRWQRVDTGGRRGEVVEVTWNANDPDHKVDANGWFGLGLWQNGALGSQNFSAYADGTLSFDMRLMYHETPNNGSSFIAKMECIHPCTSAQMPIVEGQTNYEWATHSYSLAQLRGTGLDTNQVNHALVIHPKWGRQEQVVTVQLDNIRFTPSYTPAQPEDGCLAKGNVSYRLVKADAPNADQKDAYNKITQAMDKAVEKYNCYTGLSKDLRVEYNPGVATADGSPNGNIRFGSRASMHFVTAMHEISHVFGVGSNPYRALVVDRIFTGVNATAKLRSIENDPAAKINTDGTHLWPYGLNYISEGGTEQDLINHCLLVEAMVTDI